MANFQLKGSNVHGKVLPAFQGQGFDLELWGPLDTRSRPPTKLEIRTTPPNASVRIRETLNSAKNVLELRISGLPLGSTVLQVQDRAGLVWSAVTLDVKSMHATSFTVTRQQLTDATGVVQAKYPPSPAIRALIDLLKDGTGGALKAGAGLLESAGRAGNLYEHTAGLALDIYRNSKNPAQQRQAHNLIRFFIRNRRTLGWRNMFYESWGFSSSGKVGGAPNHNDHIHIDWMDFSLLKFEGPNKRDRSKWMEITWPPEARVRTGIDTPENAKQVKAAWDDTAAAVLTDTEIVGLY
ncbi:MAG: hypothetical protein V2J55_10180 [Candidatus Competibacteraceae bacterium]|jgi:hypothetical protein|nr:hypothetical protein [Candidatus Competibacteraceae bacterium]